MLLAFKVINIVVSSRESVCWSVHGMMYESLMATKLGMPEYKMNWRVLFFIVTSQLAMSIPIDKGQLNPLLVLDGPLHFQNHVPRGQLDMAWKYLVDFTESTCQLNVSMY